MKENLVPKTRALVVLGVAAALAMAGCANDATTSSSSKGAKQVGTKSGAKVSIMVGGLNKQIYLPFELAERLGYYKDEGLNISLTDEPAGIDATTNMLAGKVDGVGGFYDHTIALQGLGQSAMSVVSMLTTPAEVELCRNDLKGKIKSPADWKGRKLGITGTGSSTDFLTQYLAQKSRVNPTTTHRIAVEAGPTLIAAMEHKNVDCAMTTEPTVSQLLATKKAYILVDTRTAAGAKKWFGGAYPATSLYMMTDYVNKNPKTVQKLVNAYVKTLKWINTHTAAQITDLMPADYYTGTGKAAYIKALDEEKGIYNPTGIMPPAGPAIAAKVLTTFNPAVKGKTIDVSKTFTDKFVQAAG
jgi:NitT/TauT family transport system substrate-binding protein